MKHIFLSTLLAVSAAAQPVPTQLQVSAPAPPIESSLSATWTGPVQPGSGSQIFYWVVVRYPVGMTGPFGPIAATGTAGINNLSATNKVAVQWGGMQSATGYDVIRNNTSTYPGSCATCAVAVNTAATSLTDTGGGSAYPAQQTNSVSDALATFSLNNVSESAPFMNFSLAGSYRLAPFSGSFTTGDCVKVVTGGLLQSNGAGCVSTSTAVTGSGLTSGLPVFGNGTTTIVVGTKRGNTTIAQMTTAGAVTSQDCARFDANGNIESNGAACAVAITANQKIRSFSGSFDGGGTALSSGKTVYTTIPYACTISAYNIVADTGTATIKFWRLATGTAIPTVSNTISSSGISLSSNTAIHSTTVSDFTSLAIAANDIIGINLFAVATATFVNVVIECDAN